MTKEPSFSAHCPHCGTSLDFCLAMTSDPAQSPVHGDLAVCFSCATLLEFSENTYRLAPASRFAEIPKELVKQMESTLHRKIHTVLLA